MNDYYAILGVMRTAELASIKGAYHGLANTYHPDKYQGDPIEANLKMSEINEAWGVLSDPEKRRTYDQQRGEVKESDQLRNEPKKSIISELSLNELRVAEATISEIPEISLNQFPWPQILCEFKISKEEARQRFRREFESVKKTLPKGVSVESIMNKTRSILVPFWQATGAATAEWAATGILEDKKQVTCAMCKGSGETGQRQNKQRCQKCKGSGIDIRTNSKKYIENGKASSMIGEYFPNYKCEIDLNLSISTADQANVISKEERTFWKCISSQSTSESDGKRLIEKILSEGLLQDVRNSLSNYNKVENIQFKPETVDYTTVVIAYLYPAYICWFKIKEKKYFAVCDAVTGSVTLPYIKPPSTLWGIIKKIVTYIFGIFVLIFVAVILTAIFSKSSKPTDIAPDTYQPISQANTSLPSATPVSPSIEASSNTTNVTGVNEETEFHPSFDCKNATSDSEKIICSDAGLSDLDNELADIYQQALLQTTDIQILKQGSISALQWRESNCHDKVCLKKWYVDRKDELSKNFTQNKPDIKQTDSDNKEGQKIKNEDKLSHLCSPVELSMHANNC